MCGRASAASAPPASKAAAAPVTAASTAAVAVGVNPLTSAFLSNRRPSPAAQQHSSLSASSSSTSSFVPATLPAISMMNHQQQQQQYTTAASSLSLSAAAISRGYSSRRSQPRAPAFRPAASSSTPLIPQSVDYPRLNRTRMNVSTVTNTTPSAAMNSGDPRGSAHALLALMESKRVDGSSVAMKQERSREREPRQSDDAFNSSASTASSSLSAQDFDDSGSSTSSKRAKREHEDASDTDSVRTERSTASSTGKTKKGLKRKFRKATHTVRKEEKEKLMCELEQLQFQMAELKRRALEGGSAQTKQHKRLTNAVLRDTLQQQLGEFADAQVLFSEYGMTQVISPISLPIRLGRDRNDRFVTLSALKEKKLELSRAFLRRRCGSLDPRKPYCEDQRFETPNGDYCAVRFSILQFEGVQSVKQVLDILQFYFCNIEISISEKLGNITIREDDDMQDKSISQNRLVGTTSSNVLLESNTVLFSDYIEHDLESDGHEYALMSAEFVDEDELYPYRPEQRVRKDINAILQLTSHTQLVRNAHNEDVEELVVVLSRWSHSRLHRPEVQVPKMAMHEMRENMERWGESMHRTLRETLYPDA